MFFYICSEGRVRKNRVIHAIELRYTLLSRDLDLVITALIGVTVDNIGINIIHTSLAIGVKNKNGKLNIIFNLWITQYIIIVNKINMVKLEIISNMKK